MSTGWMIVVAIMPETPPLMNGRVAFRAEGMRNPILAVFVASLGSGVDEIVPCGGLGLLTGVIEVMTPSQELDTGCVL